MSDTDSNKKYKIELPKTASIETVIEVINLLNLHIDTKFLNNEEGLTYKNFIENHPECCVLIEQENDNTQDFDDDNVSQIVNLKEVN